MSFVDTRCTTTCHSLSLVVIQCATRLSFYQQSQTIVLEKIVVKSKIKLLKRKELNYNFNLIKLVMVQPSRGSENFRKIHRKTSTVECCNFSTKIALHRVFFPLNFQKIFRTGLLQNTSGQLLPNNVDSTRNQKNEWLAQRRLIKSIFQRCIQNPVELLR